MGIDPADRFQNADEFKRALLGSKSKTQHLPGEYMVEPAPADAAAAENRPNNIEKASAPPGDIKSGNSKDAIPEDELPVFKKPKRKKKKGRRALSFLVWALLLLSCTIVAAVRFRPQVIPAEWMNVLSPIQKIEIPSIPWLATPTSRPAPTPTEAPTELPTEVMVSVEATVTATPAPTDTPAPTLEFTATPGNTPLPATTALGGGMGQIVFASTRDGLPQLYLTGVDGTDLKKITEMEQGACQPSWSPDGRQLVFISPCVGRGEFYETIYNEASLYIINADGTGLKQLTTSPGSDFDPAWSPDGARIAFTSVRDGFRQIYTLDVESLSVTLLTNTTNEIESSQPAWSPDGKRIAYTVKRVGTYQVWAMTDTGQETVQLARSGQEQWDFLPVWSPDGRTIFFSQRRLGPYRPWLMKANFEDLSQDAKRLDFPTPIEDLSFSPDGLWMVFEGMDASGNRDIFFMTVAGSGRTRLTNDSKIDFDPAWRPAQQ
jgi:Tol biopolymer transport system component